MLKMNKLIYGLVLMGLVLLVGCDKEETDEPVKDFTYLPELTYDEFNQMYNDGEEFFIYIGRPDCGDSLKFEQEFEDSFVNLNDDGTVNYILYDLDQKLYYLDISEIIPNFDKDLRKQYDTLHDFYFTPTLLHYKNIDDDPESDAVRMAEWDPVYGFEISQYMQWFYDTGLVELEEEVLHDGGSDREYEESGN